jgi:nitrogenase subunit NifH
VFGIKIMLYLCGVVRVVVVWVKCGVGCEGRGIMKNITYIELILGIQLLKLHSVRTAGM